MAGYTPGEWLGFVTGSGVALVSGIPADADLGTLWAGFAERGIGGLVDAVAAGTGTTASSLPEFAAAVREDKGTRVAVRGAVSLAETTDAGMPAVSGVGVTGWAEALWENARDIVISVGDSPADAERELWISAGVVMARTLTWHVADTTEAVVIATRAAAPRARGSAPEPEPEFAPEPEPEPVRAPEPTPASAPVTIPGPEPDEPSATRADGADHGGGADDDELGETLAPLRDQTYAVETDDAQALDSTFGVIWGATVGVDAITPSSEASREQPPRSGTLITGMPGTFAVSPKDHGQASTPAASAPTPSAPTPSGPPPSGQAPVLGDHDGATISVAALRELAASSAAVPTFSTPAELAQERFGRAVVSTGAVVTLDRNVIVGRTPRATRITGEMPHLVTVPSPEQDISRSHLEIRVEGSAVVAVDLNTTNGSVLIRQGSDPVRLHPGEPAVLISGDIIDIGDGVTITVEDLP